MSKRHVSASLTAAALALAWAAGSLATAKPPDLPTDTRDTCAPERDLQGEPVSNEPMPELDTRRPSPPALQVKLPAPPGVDPVKHEHARRLYLIGERCRKSGDLDMAQNCYEEARLLCPASPYAEKAGAKLRLVKVTRGAEAGTESSEVLDYEIHLDVPGNQMLPRVESAEALKERMKQLARNYGEPIVPAVDEAQLKQHFEEERKLALLKQRTETRILYLIGERCLEGGDPEMARRCYEQAIQISPRCAYGRKARERVRDLDANRGSEEASEPMDRPAVPQKKRNRRPKRIKPWLLQTQLDVDLPAVDHLLVHDFDRLLAEVEGTAAGLVIVPEAVRQTGAAEQQEPGQTPCDGLSVQTGSPTLFVDAPPRDLIVRVETPDRGEEPTAMSLDLSDWLRETVRMLDGAGSLKIDASRLGRLMAKGEGAVRALGCKIVADGSGNRYVVYPSRR